MDNILGIPNQPDPDRSAVREFTDGTEPIAATLRDARDEIDRIDEEIISLLARRALWVRDATRFKVDRNEVPAFARQIAQYERRRELAEAHDSPLEGFAELVETMYRSLIPGFVALQTIALEDTVLISELTPPKEPT